MFNIITTTIISLLMVINDSHLTVREMFASGVKNTIRKFPLDNNKMYTPLFQVDSIHSKSSSISNIFGRIHFIPI